MDTNTQMQQKKGITGSTLKFIAIFTMLIDHIGASLIEGRITQLLVAANYNYNLVGSEHAALFAADAILRGIGRVAFPIFCFLLIEGFMHTRNPFKYALRLGLFALISEFPFDLAFKGQLFDWSHQNVFFTLFLGLMVIYLMQIIDERFATKPFLRLGLTVLDLLAGAGLALFLHTDYDCFGVLTIVIMYMFRKNRWYEMLSGCVCLILMSTIELPAILSMIPVKLYNGERGLNVKYLFYIFYPAHLLVLYIICRLIGIY